MLSIYWAHLASAAALVISQAFSLAWNRACSAAIYLAFSSFAFLLFSASAACSAIFASSAILYA
jgi:hypothetical protein